MKLAWMPALLLILVCGTTASAQTGGGYVAVLDLQKVLEQHPRLQAQLKAIRQEYKSFQQSVLAKQQDLRKRAQKLQELSPGSPDFKQLQAELARIESTTAVDAKLKQKEFFTREAKAHYQAYRDITDAVARVAARHNIVLVLRYNSKRIDPDNRASIAEGLMRSVVYQHKLDITDMVVQELGGVAAQVPGTNIRR